MDLNLVYNFYNNDICIKYQLNTWNNYSNDIKSKVKFILVDDCSDEKLLPGLVQSCNLNLKVVRVKDDINWNQCGSRNLGMSLVPFNEWAFLSDIDHVLDEQNIRKILDLNKNVDKVYYFQRELIDKNDSLRYAPNIYLIVSGKFWELKGYDEDFCGAYGCEDKFFQKVITSKCKPIVLSDIIVKVLFYRTQGLDRDLSRNRTIFSNKLQQYKLGTYTNGKTIRFDWETLYDINFK